MPEPRLFINYRTSDTGVTASALYRDLVHRLGDDGSVFIDHDRIEGGEEWPERLRREVELATAMLCLIGNGWLESLDPEANRRRLDMEEDWVRREIQRALERNIPVVPVLVEGAVLPEKKDLPEVLARLPDLQARLLRRVEWNDDVDRILDDLGWTGRPQIAVPDSVSSGGSAFISWRRDVRHYLNLLITTMGERNRTSSVAFLDSYIDLAGEQRIEPTQTELEYPRERGHMVSLPQIRPAITEAVGALDQSVTMASDMIGVRTKTVSSVLSVLRKRIEPLVLLGEPGSGKSTTLRELVIQLARHALIFPGAPIPIYVELGRFRDRIDRDPNKSIVQLICDAVPPGVANLRRHLVGGEITTPIVVIFDGMDEIPRLGDYADRTAALASFATDYRVIARTVFACRTNDFDPSFGHQQLVLLPFDERRVRLFLQKTLGKRFEIDGEPQTPRSAARRLMRVDELGAEAGNPLTLSLAAHFMSKHRDWPRGRATLFDDHLASLADKALRRQNVRSPTSDQLRSTVDGWAQLAYEIFRQNGSVFTKRMALEDRVGQVAVTHAIEGGLILEDVEAGLLKFRHHRLQEFLVARRLHLPDPPRPEWSTILASPRWQETLLNFFAIGGRNNEALTVILDSLRPAEEYFKDLRPHIDRTQEDITAAQHAYDAIRPDEVESVGDRVIHSYSPQQQAKKNEAGERLTTVRRSLKELQTLPPDRETEWSDHVLFAARVCALLKLPRSETPNLYEPILQTLTGLLDFGRPAAQVRMLLAWRESADWCPASVLESVRNSPSDWVRSQTIYALASTPLQEDRVDRAFSTELEQELLNLQLLSNLPIFWNAAPLRPGRRLQVVFAIIIHLVFVLLVVGAIVATSAFVTQRLSDALPAFANVSTTLLSIAWISLVGVVAVLTVPILRWSLITRLAAANAIAGTITLIILGVLAKGSLLHGPATLTVFLQRVGVVFTALTVPLLTAIGLWSVVVITRLVFRTFAGPGAPGSSRNQDSLSFAASLDAMQIGGGALLVGVIAGIVSALDAPWTEYLFGMVAGVLVLVAAISFIPLIGDWFSSRWRKHNAEPVPKRIALLVAKTLAPIGIFVLVTGLILAVMALIISGVEKLFGGLIRVLIPDALPTILANTFFGILIAAIILFVGFLIGTFVLGAFGRTFSEIRYLLFRRRLQRHPFQGNLEEWERAFRGALKLRRRELLDAFDYRAMGVAPQDALKTFHRLEEFVELGDPGADIFHQTMYKLQEAIRQQRWIDPDNSR